MTVRDILQKMQEILEAAKTMPLSQSVLVNKAELLELIDMLAASLPAEFDAARTIMAERDAVVADAEREAARVIEKALAESAVLVSDQEVYRRALEESDRERATAGEDIARMRRETDDYVDAKLAAFEAVLSKTLDVVAAGRNKLHVRIQGDNYVEESHPEPGTFFADWQEPDVR